MTTNTGSGKKPPSVGEFLFNELRSAIRDVRLKLLDEGWFGRRSASNTQADGFSFDVNPQPDPSEAFYGRRPSFEERWATREPSQEKTAQDRGHDIDR